MQACIDAAPRPKTLTVDPLVASLMRLVPYDFKPCDQQKSSGHSFHYKYRVVLTRPPRFPYKKKLAEAFLHGTAVRRHCTDWYEI